MSADAILRWNGNALEAMEGPVDGSILVADSWLALGGAALALDLHRERFLETAQALHGDAATFWDAAVAALPRTGEWFPRVELRDSTEGPQLLLRVRTSPPRHRSATLVTHEGDDPRTLPRIKGPSLERLERLRAEARTLGADDIVITGPLGHIVEGAATAIAWWRGNILCMPAPELERVGSVTARAVAALAAATGIQTSWETTAPEELDGLEVWALNALHGPRIVTRWIDGPPLAEEPGRLSDWRARLGALRRPLPVSAAEVVS